MSIFRRLKIKPGDLVIGCSRQGWSKNGVSEFKRYFTTPSIVLEVNEQQALVYFEQTGPKWYDITKLEKVYVEQDQGLAE